MRLFKKEERSSFPYWFAHWCAFNMVALDLHVWKFKYLFHDIEKPWLMLLWRDYKKVQQWHRKHARHHIEYGGRKGYDFEAMVIDWECSRFTKENAQLNAFNTLFEKELPKIQSGFKIEQKTLDNVNLPQIVEKIKID